jgi:hypothetical protein
MAVTVPAAASAIDAMAAASNRKLPIVVWAWWLIILPGSSL